MRTKVSLLSLLLSFLYLFALLCHLLELFLCQEILKLFVVLQFVLAFSLSQIHYPGSNKEIDVIPSSMEPTHMYKSLLSLHFRSNIAFERNLLILRCK